MAFLAESGPAKAQIPDFSGGVPPELLDSLGISSDTLSLSDSLAVPAEKPQRQAIDSPVEYSAKDSIDYAVMEKTEHAAVVPLDAGWSDVGSWSVLWHIEEKDKDRNIFKGDIVSQDTSGSYIRAENRLVTAVGLKDIVIVETADAVLVASKDKVQDVKNIVTQLQSKTRNEIIDHPKNDPNFVK